MILFNYNTILELNQTDKYNIYMSIYLYTYI